MKEHNDQLLLFCSDYFFYYLLHHSNEVRLLLANHFSKTPVISTTIEHSDEFGPTYDLKKMILDIVLKDNQNCYYALEMQNGPIDREELIRFISYAAKLLEREIKKGHGYDVNCIHMLIIYTGRPIVNFKHYQHCIEFMDSDYLIKIKDGPISIEIIQTQRMEELPMEIIRKDEFHQFIYLFENEDNHRKEQESEVCQKVVKLYEDYLNSDELLAYYRAERDRRYIHTKIDKAKKIGIVKGKHESIREFVKKRYHTTDIQWLDTCTNKQLEYIYDIIFDVPDYQQFKEKILSIK